MSSVDNEASYIDVQADSNSGESRHSMAQKGYGRGYNLLAVHLECAFKFTDTFQKLEMINTTCQQ